MITKTIHIERVAKSNASSLENLQLGFGTIHTDHMMLARYSNGAWDRGIIQPFRNLSLSPFALCFHYGQTVFEGLKAFRTIDGNVSIFRADQNLKRMNKSLERMGMPELPEDLWWNGLLSLIEEEATWIPDDPEASLYIRPFVIATEDKLGVKVSDEYYFMIVCSPVGPYYSQALEVKLEQQYTRAAAGGTGAAKCGGNYGGSLYPFRKAKEEGFDQIIWTDAKTHAYIEESGTMNIMFIIGEELLTPALSDTILAGVTRASLLQLARDKGMQVKEGDIHYQEIVSAIEAGKHVEAFGVGTAAVIAPIKSITVGAQTYPTYHAEDARMFELKQALLDIRLGNVDDTYQWNTVIKLG